MHPNIIHPFLTKVDGVIVNDFGNDPTSSDHCISFEINDLNIPLKLSGTFSYFYSLRPHMKEIQEQDKVFITPDSDDWNPHC